MVAGLSGGGGTATGPGAAQQVTPELDSPGSHPLVRPSTQQGARRMTTSHDETAVAPSALDGVRVLDFTQMMLGPFATQLLADLGADVIKVERPEVGEWERGLRFAGQLLGSDSAAFVAMNRNKRSVAIDLKATGACDALLRLGATCDVVVENFRPGVMDRLGLGYADFRAVRPDIIYCSGSGWGQRTKYAQMNRPGQDLLVQAATGLAFNTGTAEDPPTQIGRAHV